MAPPGEAYLIELVGLARGEPTPHDGSYLVHYDPVAHYAAWLGCPLGEIVTTRDPERAHQFASKADAVRCWQQEAGTRPDGKPNRPLTSWTILIRSVADAILLTRMRARLTGAADEPC